MRAFLLFLIIITCAFVQAYAADAPPPAASAAPASLWLHAGPAPADSAGAAAQPLHLIGPDARRQLLATAAMPDGTLRDLTRDVTYSVAPATVAKVEKTGLLTPLADGSATITAKPA